MGILLVLVIVLRIWKPRQSTVDLTQDFTTREMTVGTGDLETTLTLQGTTKFSDSQKLTFMNQGKVKSVNVKVGETVKKGQVLATITTDDLDSQVQQARINLDDAKQSLQDLLDGYNLDLEYLQQKANYDTLQLKQTTIDQDHALALLDLQQQIETAKQTVIDSEKTYTDTKADYEELLSGSNSASADLALSSTIRKRNTTFQNAILDLKNIIVSVQSALDAFDQKMGLSDKYKSQTNSQEIYIGAKDPNIKKQAETLFWTLSNQLSGLVDMEKKLEALSTEKLTNQQILDAYTLVKNMGSNLVSRGEMSYTMFKASIDNISYTQSQIDADAKTATSNQSLGITYIQKYSTMVDSLAAIKEDTSLEDTKLKMEKAYTSREKAKTSLKKLELSVEVKRAEQEKEKADLANNIDTVQRNIAKIQKGESLNESKIKQAKNTITQRQNSLNSLLDKYVDYKLEANFDGVVTQMDIQVGDSVSNSSNSTPKYIYVENNNVLEMTLSVEQVDIVKLKQNMEVVVYLDAYPTTHYRGIISAINTVPASSAGITTYEVTVIFEKSSPDEVILAGMGGNAKVITAQTKNVLVVPNQAISRKDGQNVVKLLKGGTWIDQPVVL
ncbi:MAG: HlyD family efflux transporter periplasmic adaptor subunit [Candidatus Peribacteria bacterium]|nr:HlyD family efflux transporter periplasmic adaptor subunit [Candidatus Peribacteria bacterium]